ncbi:putative pectinesterase 31 [Tanacetum coccineum]
MLPTRLTLFDAAEPFVAAVHGVWRWWSVGDVGELRWVVYFYSKSPDVAPMVSLADSSLELHDVHSSCGGQDTQLLPFSVAVTTRRSKYGSPPASRSERFPEIVTTRKTLKITISSYIVVWLARTKIMGRRLSSGGGQGLLSYLFRSKDPNPANGNIETAVKIVSVYIHGQLKCRFGGQKRYPGLASGHLFDGGEQLLQFQQIMNIDLDMGVSRKNQFQNMDRVMEGDKRRNKSMDGQKEEEERKPEYGSGYGRRQEDEQGYGSGCGRKQEEEERKPEYGSGYGRRQEEEERKPEYGSGYGRRQEEEEEPKPVYGSGYGRRREEEEEPKPEYGSGYGRRKEDHSEERYGGRREEEYKKPSYGRRDDDEEENEGYGGHAGVYVDRVEVLIQSIWFVVHTET